MTFPIVAGLSLDPVAKPVADVLSGIYKVVPNYGVAIMLLALGWMILISPLTLKTTRSMLAMQRLQPQLKKLQEQHRNDRQALSQATMDLYREEGVSPFGSCLPTILPLPVFFALFRVIDGLSTVDPRTGLPAPRYLARSSHMYHDIVAAGGHINAFGVDLSKNVLSHHPGISTTAAYVLLLLIMMGTQYWQTVSMMNRNPANADNPQARMMKYLPLVFGVVCVRFPAGVILYYGTSNLCRIAQQYLMYNFDPKVKQLAVRDAKVIDAEARDIESGKRPRVLPGDRGTGAAGGAASAGEAVATQPAARTRFRDLLAKAAETQQEQRRRPDSGGAGGAAGGSGGGRGGSRVARKPAPTKGGGGAAAPLTGASASTNAGGAKVSNPGNGKAGAAAASAASNTNRSRTGASAGRTGAGRPARTKKRRGS